MERASSHNYLFIGSVIALMLFGLGMLATASAVLAFNHTFDNFYYVKQQILNGLVGFLFFFIASRFPYEKLKKIALPCMIGAIILTALVLMPGIGVMEKGASRWLMIGSFSFQPSEFLKLASIIYLAALFEQKKGKNIKDNIIPLFAIGTIVTFLLLQQPDLGTLGIILCTALAVYFLAGAKISHIILIILTGIIAVSLFVYSKDYARERIEVFLNPSQDVQGAGYQIYRARAMIHSGGLLGIGYGQSQQKSTTFLPEPMGDSIFAVTAQELGFIGVSVAVLLFVLLGWQGFSVAKNSRTEFGRVLAGGITVWVLVQAFINMSAISGMMPLTGIPLPFISYGGTSLVVLLTACGIVYNIQRDSL